MQAKHDYTFYTMLCFLTTVHGYDYETF